MINQNGLTVGAPFPVVGIGASAGGLVALEQFLSKMPPTSGMAFVVVQHLDPNRSGMLVELLQRRTPMPTAEVQDRMRVQPDHVYVIPPGRDLTVLHGVLHLLDPPEARGLRLPIDFFFKSLADDQQQNSIGVILSGMGSDGTAGLRAIRQVAGACFVQQPSDAQFDSMPRSAIDAGVADVIAPASALPQKILAFVGRVQLGVRAVETAQKDAGFFEKVVVLLRTQTGHDFSLYKKSTIARRIARRMGLHQLSRMADYLRYLRENPQESELLFNELLIGVTSFFRDPPVWEQLKTEVFPELLSSHPGGTTLRAWTPGCSTGEEAYSLAMVFQEVQEELHPPARFTLQIFATDLDKEAIAIGRAGVYSRSIASEVSEERLKRFFVADPGGYRICNEIREMVIFAEQNVIASAPFINLHVLSCRNLLIYLEAALQVKLMQLFHYSLVSGGFLLLGRSESVGAISSLFHPIQVKSQIYRRLETPKRIFPVDFPAVFVRSPSTPDDAALLQHEERVAEPNLQLLVERTVLERYGPAAVLVAGQGDVLYFSGQIGKYLAPAAGKPNLSLFAMTRDGLHQALVDGFQRAVREKAVVKLKNVKVDGHGATRYVDVVVDPLDEPVALRGMVLVVFSEVVQPRHRRPRGTAADPAENRMGLESLEHELQQSREETNTVRDAMQTTQEELKSSNEEFQSANEELQSANEELTTSKEEMQSMNEELQTLNHELQAKVAELSRTSDDMKNLLESTEIATLFLDDALNVRRFTAQTTKIIKLIPGDAGRPITDIVSDLVYPEMLQDAKEVLRTLAFREIDATTTDGRWFKVRTMPYRTQENRIDGLVITFTDITASKKLEAELRATKAKFQTVAVVSKSQEVGDGLS